MADSRDTSTSPITAPAEPPTVERLMAELLPSARKLLGMEIAFVSEISEGRRVFRYISSERGFEPISVGGSDPLEESYCQRVIDGRLPELIQDATREPEAMTLAATLALPVGAHLSVPIRFNSGRVFGTFCCFSRQPDTTLGRRDLATMRFFAEILGKVLEQQDIAQAAHRLVASRTRTLLDHHLHSTVFQPIVDVSRDQVIGFEALARFRGEPYRPPNEWLDDAAAVGMLEELEQALHRDALQHLDALPAQAYMSLNITPATVLGPQFAERLGACPPARLVLEITEHESVNNYEAIAHALQPLRQQGVRLAIDDVGAGYANFRHILRLKPDIIKLDQSLIRHIDTECDSRTLTTALLQFSQGFGCQVVAEGVETQAELATLKGLGVRLMQGYLLGRPQPL